MITEGVVEIDAPASVVWDVFSDVERWAEWTESVDRITALDGAEVAVGNRFRIEQQKFPKLVWQVTEVEPGVSWTWRQKSPGGTTFATHEVVPQGDRRTLVRQRIDQRGPFGWIVGKVTRKLTNTYLEKEAEGLKARSEERARHDAPST